MYGNHNGHIMLHRKLLDNPIVCKDADHLAVWVWLLLNAAWKEHDVLSQGKRITLSPGQLPPISRKLIASELHISESKVQRILKAFEIEHQIEQQTNNHNRLISIVSWCDYQQSEQQNEQQVNSKRTASEQQVNSIQNKDNKGNKGNKEKKDIQKQTVSQAEQEFEQLWLMYPNKKGKADAKKKYIKARQDGTTFDDVKKGIEAYVQFLKTEHISGRFVKHGSTFFSEQAWQDDWAPSRSVPYQRSADDEDILDEFF